MGVVFQNKKSRVKITLLFFMAERKGFEPLLGYKPKHDFQSCALDQLSHLSVLIVLEHYITLFSLCQVKFFDFFDGIVEIFSFW